MIKYSLKCVENSCIKKDPFDSWFQNSTSYKKQIEAGYISCPYCGSLNIRKNLMSPALKINKNIKPSMDSKKLNHSATFQNTNKKIDMMVVLRNLKKEIQKNAEFVGDNFVKEAKAIHEGKSKERAIYGEADPKDLEELKSNNIDFVNVPWVRDDN